MSIGKSGRIVIEVEPVLKKDLYSSLAKEGLTLKEWFLKNAVIYLDKKSQTPLKKSIENVSEILTENKK